MSRTVVTLQPMAASSKTGSKSQGSAPARAPRAAQPQTYSSPAIRARRRRILEESRRMIAEDGLLNFNMNELCKRAGVAKRTLYNAFQTREQLIAIAISEYFQEYVDRIPYSAPVGTLQNNLERLVSVTQRNVHIRNYIRAIMSIFFSADADSNIWRTMQGMATRPTLEWLANLAARRQLQPWIEPQNLADDLVRLEYGIVNDWSLGRLSDDDLTPHLLLSFLTYMAGATRGAANTEIREAIRHIQEHGVPMVSAVPKTPGRDRKAAG
jgi:AcrR family transcriptional regulator